MRNVNFHLDDNIALDIKSLRGALLRAHKASPPVFDDKRSFIVRIDSGTIGITIDSLTNLMNNYVFAYPHSPLKNLRITTHGNQIEQEGTMHKVIDVPFRMVGDLSVTADGKIRLHPTSIKAGGIAVKGLMHLFGVELDELIKAREARGVKIDDNDLIMDPERMTPPPNILGKVTAVQIIGNEVIQIFGSGTDGSGASAGRLNPSYPKAANYMYYRGGTLRFGKLTMVDADLQIIDQAPKDIFDFSIDHYNQQLVAGYSKNMRNFGLVVFMPDYYRLQRTTASLNYRRGAKHAERPPS
ncbi:MAG TPA: hypothetical protein VGK99_11150 [Acidobacteriota bacterium]|jgi:hypothetical protein